MNDIAVYTLTSPLHDLSAIKETTIRFLDELDLHYTFCDADYTDYGSHALDVIFVRSGGTEMLFRQLLPKLQLQSSQQFVLLTSGQSNSLAASMEILSFLRQQGLRGEIVHGDMVDVSMRLQLLAKVGRARLQLRGLHLGVIGQPSDWLIASNADYALLKQKLGVELVDIPMEELLVAIRETPIENQPTTGDVLPFIEKSLPGAMQIYQALKTLVARYDLSGFTLRCFDLLSAVHNTGCLALAKLNAEGIVAGCEGDVPTLLTMAVIRQLAGVSGFQANPSRIDPKTGEIVFAHCTIPLDMITRYEYDTHFESGIGVGIRGSMPEGPVTIFKLAGDLSRSFVAEGTLEKNLSEPDLCRTQILVRLDEPAQTAYFFNNPIGNHHVILSGRFRRLLEMLMCFFVLLLTACRVAPFTTADDSIPSAPDYQDTTQWYVSDRHAEADVFYVISTETGDYVRPDGVACHYADTYNDSLRAPLYGEMLGVDSLLSGALNYYSPYYRQCSLQSFETDSLAAARMPLALDDVRRAFRHYLDHQNGGRPFILAGFSQGAHITLQLLREMDDADYQRLIAAYAIGVTIPDSLLGPHVVAAKESDDTGVTICYNSVRDVDCAMRGWEHSSVAINPVNWCTDSTAATLITEPSPLLPVAEQKKDTMTVRLDVRSGLLLVDGFTAKDYVLPLIGKEGNYHSREIWLYRDQLRTNMALRARVFLKAQ